jgi:hypothetical protein
VSIGDMYRPEPTITYIPPAQRDSADQAAIDWLHGRRASWTPPPATFEIPPLERAAWTATHRRTAGAEGVPAGWSAAGWIHRLRSLAHACQGLNPGLAARHRKAADRLAAISERTDGRDGRRAGLRGAGPPEAISIYSEGGIP